MCPDEPESWKCGTVQSRICPQNSPEEPPVRSTSPPGNHLVPVSHLGREPVATAHHSSSTNRVEPLLRLMLRLLQLSRMHARMDGLINHESLKMTTLARTQELLRVGIPSVRSRLHPKIMNCLSLSLSIDSHQLVFSSNKVTVFFLRPWDLPSLVATGQLDAAFCGTDVVTELQADVEICHQFDEYRAPLALCKKIGLDLEEVSPLLVATEYAQITERYLKKRGGDFRILRVHGACEAYPRFDGISAIVDIVETGATLRANNLEIVDTADFTSPCLIQGRTSKPNRKIELIEWRDLVAEALAKR